MRLAPDSSRWERRVQVCEALGRDALGFKKKNGEHYVINYKVEWDEELARRKKLGIDAPGPVPHPDDIIIDMDTGLVRVTGPMTKEDKQKWDKLRDLKRTIRMDIEEMAALLDEHPAEREQIETEIKHSERLLKMISAVIHD